MKDEKERKAIGKKRIIASIVASLVLVTIVVAVGMMIYTRNVKEERFVYNNDIENNNEEMINENGGNNINNKENKYMQMSNYVIAGSDEAKRNEEMLKEALEEERLKNIQKETEGNIKEQGTKYASQDIVKLASNGGNVPQTMALLDITGGELTLDKMTYTYNGQRNVPNPTLKVGGQILILGKDYTIEYKNNINAGTATAIARGINDYSGTKETSFTISAKTITVEVEGETQFAYDGAEHKPKVKSPIEGENGDKIYLKLNVAGDVTPIDAGVYTAKVEIEKIDKGEVKAEPGTITVNNTITTDVNGNTAAEDKVKKGTRLYIQITANQVNGEIKSVYANGKYLPKNASGKYYLEITENGEYGFAVVGSENTSQYYKVTVANYIENQIPENLKVGDYVNYKELIDGSSTYTTNSKSEGNTGYSGGIKLTRETTDWRVLSIDEEKGEILITTNGIVNSGIYLYGAKGYFGGAKELDNICEVLYSSSKLGLTARSMTIEDLNKACGYTPAATTDADRYAFYPYAVRSQSGTIEYNGKTYNKVRHYNGKYPSGRFLTSKIDGGGVSGGIEDGYEYVEASTTSPVYLTNTYYTYNPSSQNSKVGEILGSSSGWLASPCVSVGSEGDGTYTYFTMRSATSRSVYGEGLYISSSGVSYGGGYGVHPVVSLDFNVLIDTSDTTRDGSTPAKAWILTNG